MDKMSDDDNETLIANDEYKGHLTSSSLVNLAKSYNNATQSYIKTYLNKSIDT
jgi:hypothetical protein